MSPGRYSCSPSLVDRSEDVDGGVAVSHVDHVAHAHVGVVGDIAGGEKHVEIDRLGGAVSVVQPDRAPGGGLLDDLEHAGDLLAPHLVLEGRAPQLVREPSRQIDQVRNPRGRVDDVAPLVEHGTGHVGGEESHAGQGQGDLHGRVLALSRREDALLRLGQGQARHVEGTHGGNEDAAHRVDLHHVGEVELSPDVELQRVPGTDDVGIGVDLPVLADAQLLHLLAGGQAKLAGDQVLAEPLQVGPGDLLQLGLFLLPLVDHPLQLLLVLGTGRTRHAVHGQGECEAEQPCQHDSSCRRLAYWHSRAGTSRAQGTYGVPVRRRDLVTASCTVM